MGSSPHRVARLGLGGSRVTAAGPPTHEPACLRCAGLMPIALFVGVPCQRVSKLIIRLWP